MLLSLECETDLFASESAPSHISIKSHSGRYHHARLCRTWPCGIYIYIYSQNRIRKCREKSRPSRHIGQTATSVFTRALFWLLKLSQVFNSIQVWNGRKQLCQKQRILCNGRSLLQDAWRTCQKRSIYKSKSMISSGASSRSDQRPLAACMLWEIAAIAPSTIAFGLLSVHPRII